MDVKEPDMLYMISTKRFSFYLRLRGNQMGERAKFRHPYSKLTIKRQRGSEGSYLNCFSLLRHKDGRSPPGLSGETTLSTNLSCVQADKG